MEVSRYWNDEERLAVISLMLGKVRASIHLNQGRADSYVADLLDRADIISSASVEMLEANREMLLRGLV